MLVTSGTSPSAGEPVGLTAQKIRERDRIFNVSLRAFVGRDYLGHRLGAVARVLAFFPERIDHRFPDRYPVDGIIRKSALRHHAAGHRNGSSPLGRAARGFAVRHVIAIYLSEYAAQPVREILKPILELLSAVPTVVFGYFALLFVTPILQSLLPDLPGSTC